MKIKQDFSQKNKWYCVLQNPYTKEYDTQIIWGGSEEIVKRKIEKALTKLKEEI